jgi:hypothetical protein
MSWFREACLLIHVEKVMGTSNHLRGVGTAGSMFKTSRRVSFLARLVGSSPKRMFTILSGSWKLLLLCVVLGDLA